MDFLNQSWFWAGLIPVLAILTKEWLTSRTQIKLERLKLYEPKTLNAYNILNSFIQYAYAIYDPTDDLKEQFGHIINSSKFKEVKGNLIFFNKRTRSILNTFESQYFCLYNPDCIPEKPFKDFIDNDFFKLLKELESIVNKWSDQVIEK